MLNRIAKHCRAYQGADLTRSLGQAAISLGLYFLLMAAIIYCAISARYLILAMLTLPAGGLLVKLFTIQHDCGHGSYFNNRTANFVLGFAISILTFTPYEFWRDAHNRHHASSGHLDKRGVGGVDTLTVDEYWALPRLKRIFYRAYRNPLVLVVFGAPFYFFILQRFPLVSPMPFSENYSGLKLRQIWKSVVTLNLALVVFYSALAIFFGAGVIALSVIPVVTIAAWVGTWLFFVQHQYEDAYWARSEDWNYNEAAVFGSSHYDLPKILQWFSGNIGFHHIHHLSSMIPNYRLQECYQASEDLQTLPKLTLLESMSCARLALWDEACGKMVSFTSLRMTS